MPKVVRHLAPQRYGDTVPLAARLKSERRQFCNADP